MHRFEPSEVKALFGQLVDSVGTHDAAAVFLGVSRQRVSQLISTSCTDLPTVAQIAKLEDVCGTSIVFAALARRNQGATTGDVIRAGVAAAGASTTALATAHAALADGIIEEEEAERAQDDARRALEAAQRHFDATMQMKPTLRVVQ